MDIYKRINRGDIFYVDKFGDTVGSEQKSGRPAIIVSNDTNNDNSEVVEIVYMTTKPKRDLPTHVTIRSAPQISTALCEQITSVSVQKLQNYVGSCTKAEMAAIDNALAISLDIDGTNIHRGGAGGTIEKPKATVVIEKPWAAAHQSSDSAEIAELRQRLAEERAWKETYKKLYDRLLFEHVKNMKESGQESVG